MIGIMRDISTILDRFIMSQFTKTVYNLLFRRSATIALSIVVGVFAYERIINKSAEYIYERRNQGKLWKHVQPQFKLATGDEEEEASDSS